MEPCTVVNGIARGAVWCLVLAGMIAGSLGTVIALAMVRRLDEQDQSRDARDFARERMALVRAEGGR